MTLLLQALALSHRTCSHLQVLAVKSQKVVFAVEQDVLSQFSNHFCPTCVLELKSRGEHCAPASTALPLSSLKGEPQGSVSKAALEAPFHPTHKVSLLFPGLIWSAC